MNKLDNNGVEKEAAFQHDNVQPSPKVNEHDNVSDDQIEGVINSVIQDNLVDDSAKDNLVDDNKVLR